MSDFWNKRFGAKEYAYGEKPNRFFKQELEKLSPGKILLPAEGEGRNAVFAAKLGWEVTAFDSSEEGKTKAEKLAEKHQVKIEYVLEENEQIDLPKDSFDCVGLIFVQTNRHKRSEYHQKIVSFLKPGGILILEGFSKKQINKGSGGPRSIDMLFSKEELEHDFATFSTLEITEANVSLSEGRFHQGIASVIRVVGVK